jgi:hypothetical protein
LPPSTAGLCLLSSKSIDDTAFNYAQGQLYCEGEYEHLRSIRKVEGIRVVGGVADKEAYAAYTINIISHQQYFVACCLISCVFG